MRLEGILDTTHLFTGPANFLLNGFITQIQVQLFISITKLNFSGSNEWVRVVIARQGAIIVCLVFSMKMTLSQPVGSSPGLDMEQIVRSYQCRLQKSWFMFQTPAKIYISKQSLWRQILRGVMNILALPNCKTGTCRRCHCLFFVYAKK